MRTLSVPSVCPPTTTDPVHSVLLNVTWQAQSSPEAWHFADQSPALPPML